MKYRTIKNEIFKVITLFSINILVIFGILLGSFLYFTFYSNVKSYLRQRNQALKFLLEGYFVKLHNYIDFLSRIDGVRNVLLLGEENRKEVLKIFRDFELSDPDINYIYAGFKDGSLLINNYIPPPGFNSTVRPWYKIAIKKAPNISDGLPYREIKTKEWLISISKALIDKNNNISGVIAIDTSLHRLVQKLNQSLIGEGFKSQNSFVITNRGDIIIHKNEKLLRKNFYDLYNILKDKHEIEYKNSGKTKLAFLDDVNVVGWKVVTEIDKKEIIMSIVVKILGSLGVVIFISLFLGWFLSKLLGNRIVKPITELKERVQHLIEGKHIDKRINTPKNEIEKIAADLEKLTENGLYKKNLQLKKLTEELRILSITDQLTGVFNRRKIDSDLRREFIRAKRYNRIFSLILLDIDFFKKINDRFGHDMGDLVLQKVSNLIIRNIRECDTAGRWGGEEFMIICPETNGIQATALAEKLRRVIESYDFGVNRPVTISIGIAEFLSTMKDIDELIKIADKNLYKAKRAGRNRVVFTPIQDTPYQGYHDI